MTKVPGLTPLRDDAPVRLQRNNRAIGWQEANTRLPALRPAASPTNTYARPTPPVRDDSLARLADALSVLNPALQNFGSVMNEERKTKAISSVDMKLAQAGTPEAIQTLLDNDPEVRTAAGNAAAMRFMGKKAAADAVNEARTAYENGFDRQNGNFDEFAAGFIKKHGEKFGRDQHFRESFMADVQPGLAQLRNAHAQFRSGEEKQQTQQATSDVFLGAVRKGEAEGKSAADQAQAVFAEFYGNNRLLKMPYRDQMQALQQVVVTLANEGKYDVVNALVNLDRKDASGGHVGKLLDNNIVGPAMAQAVVHAKQVRDKRNHETGVDERQQLFDRFHAQGDGAQFASPEDEKKLREMVKRNDGSMSEATANSWIQANRTRAERARAAAIETQIENQNKDRAQMSEAAITNNGVEAMKAGKLDSLPQITTVNDKGVESTLTPKEVRQRAVEDYAKWSRAFATQNKETWEQTFMREVKVYSANGVAPEDWKETFERGARSMNAIAVNGGDMPESAVRAYEMYKRLYANEASSMLKDLIPRDQRDLYEAWRVAEQEIPGMNPAKAAIVASKFVGDPTERERRRLEPAMRAIREAADQNFPREAAWWNVFGGSTSGENADKMKAEVVKRAEIYAAMGLNSRAAITNAVKAVKDSHINVNGWWIDASDKNMHPQFASLAHELVREYANEYGKAENVTADVLSVAPVGRGSGKWFIIDKRTGTPVDNPTARIFTHDDLLAANAHRKAERDRQTLERMKGNVKPAPAEPALSTLGLLPSLRLVRPKDNLEPAKRDEWFEPLDFHN